MPAPQRHRHLVLLTDDEYNWIINRAGITKELAQIVGDGPLLRSILMGLHPNAQGTPTATRREASTRTPPTEPIPPVQSRNGPWLPTPAKDTRGRSES